MKDCELKYKRELCVSLKHQKNLMLRNSELMEKIYPNGNHLELRGAAKITQDWINAIESEPNVKGVFK